MSMNALNGFDARKFAFTWNYPEFYSDYFSLVEKLKAEHTGFSTKKLIRFFNDLNRDLKEWKARAIRDNSVMRNVSGLLLVVETGKYKVGDIYSND